MSNTFAEGREYFDDDPLAALGRNGIRQEDFSLNEPWDQYAIVRDYLQIWNAVSDYAAAFVDGTYPNDVAVAEDDDLQDWIEESGENDEGNIRGLPAMDSKAALVRVLSSLLYRITMHGCSRLSPVANPGLTFVANFPPCLQIAKIPSPTAHLDPQELLTYLPKTGTIGAMMTFYYTFVFSDPYEPFIPAGGAEADLFFPGGLTVPHITHMDIPYGSASASLNSRRAMPKYTAMIVVAMTRWRTRSRDGDIVEDISMASAVYSILTGFGMPWTENLRAAGPPAKSEPPLGRCWKTVA